MRPWHHAADDARAMDFTNNSLNAMDPDTTDHEATDPEATDAEILEYLSSLVASNLEQGWPTVVLSWFASKTLTHQWWLQVRGN